MSSKFRCPKFQCPYFPNRLLYLQGILVVLGGFIVELTTGSLYTFGNMAPYIVSYIRNRSSPADLHQDETLALFSVVIMAEGMGNILSGVMLARVGPRITTIIGSVLLSAGVSLSFFTIKSSFWALLVTYGIMYGLGVGISSIPPLGSAMRWFPEYKGVVGGIVSAGYGLSPLIFDVLETAYINPRDVTTVMADGDKANYFTDSNLLDRIPYAFLLLAGIYTIMQFIGCLFIDNPPKGYAKSQQDERTVDSRNVLEVDDDPAKREKSPSLFSAIVKSLTKSYKSLSVEKNPFHHNGSSSSTKGDVMDVKPSTSKEYERKVLSEDIDNDKQSLISAESGDETQPFISKGQSRKSDDLTNTEPVSDDVGTTWTSDDIISLTPLQSLKMPYFYVLWVIMDLELTSTLFLTAYYKFFGNTFIRDDKFLALVGSISFCFNGIGRIAWGFLADWTTFKLALILIATVLTIFQLTFYATISGGKAMFFIWICTMLFSVGGAFSLFPSVLGYTYGLKHVSMNYGIFTISKIVSAPFVAVISVFLVPHIGFSGLFFLSSAFSGVALVLSLLYRQKVYIAVNRDNSS